MQAHATLQIKSANAWNHGFVATSPWTSPHTNRSSRNVHLPCSLDLCTNWIRRVGLRLDSTHRPVRKPITEWLDTDAFKPYHRIDVRQNQALFLISVVYSSAVELLFNQDGNSRFEIHSGGISDQYSLRKDHDSVYGALSNLRLKSRGATRCGT